MLRIEIVRKVQMRQMLPRISRRIRPSPMQIQHLLRIRRILKPQVPILLLQLPHHALILKVKPHTPKRPPYQKIAFNQKRKRPHLPMIRPTRNHITPVRTHRRKIHRPEHPLLPMIDAPHAHHLPRHHLLPRPALQQFEITHLIPRLPPHHRPLRPAHVIPNLIRQHRHIRARHSSAGRKQTNHPPAQSNTHHKHSRKCKVPRILNPPQNPRISFSRQSPFAFEA